MIKNNQPMDKLDKLYDYLFHYNPYQKVWYAFNKNDSTAYFNGDRKIAIKNEDLDELVTDILMKYQKKDAN
jgi:hypothetical protein